MYDQFEEANAMPQSDNGLTYSLSPNSQTIGLQQQPINNYSEYQRRPVGPVNQMPSDVIIGGTDRRRYPGSTWIPVLPNAPMHQRPESWILIPAYTDFTSPVARPPPVVTTLPPGAPYTADTRAAEGGQGPLFRVYPSTQSRDEVIWKRPGNG